MGKNTQGRSQLGSKGGPSAPNPHSIPNREAFQRMNFLYQASAYLGSVDASRQSQNHRWKKPSRTTLNAEEETNVNAMNEDADAGAMVDEVAASSSRVSSSANLNEVKHRNTRKKAKKATLSDLGAKYVNDLRIIGNKSVLRIDPSVKRKLCKSCNAVLMPGTTATVRIKSSRNRGTKKVVYTCLHCKASRSISATPTIAPPVTSKDTVDCDMANDENASSESTLKATERSTLDGNTDTNGRTSPNKHQGRQRQTKYKVTPSSERGDAGHMIVIGDEVVPFE